MSHSHTPDVTWAEVVDDLGRSADVSLPRTREMLAWLAPPTGCRTADVGCGAGAMTMLMAEAVGPDGHVVAIDAEPALLAATARRCQHAGLDGRVTTMVHDLATGPLPTTDRDLVWAGHVVHHLPDQQAAVEALAVSLTPGGRLALAEGGLPARCLPWDLGVGEPGLEDRLAAAEACWFAAMRRELAGARRSPQGWSTMLADAGLVQVTARSFLLDVPPPLEESVRTHVLESLSVRVDRFRDLLSSEDRSAWERLLQPAGGDFLGHRDDVHLLSASTVHVGTRP